MRAIARVVSVACVGVHGVVAAVSIGCDVIYIQAFACMRVFFKANAPYVDRAFVKRVLRCN